VYVISYTQGLPRPQPTIRNPALRRDFQRAREVLT
jgi:hypothetical protein